MLTMTEINVSQDEISWTKRVSQKTKEVVGKEERIKRRKMLEEMSKSQNVEQVERRDVLEEKSSLKVVIC